ncbi:zinc finger protein 391-like [Ptychodera flava]|uniref:zinc finger protein 391-like n=1 Tax=Ptychodera flava TaxID=63121 RepID=UPI00396A797B
MAIESLQVDGCDVSVELPFAEANIKMKHVFLPRRGRLRKMKTFLFAGERVLTIGRGFVKSISAIYQRYQKGTLTSNDIQIIMDTFACYGHLSLWHLDVPPKYDEDEHIHSRRAASTKERFKVMRPRSSARRLREQGNREKRFFHLEKPVRKSSRREIGSGNKNLKKNVNGRLKRHKTMGKRIRLKSKEVECRGKNNSKSLKQTTVWRDSEQTNTQQAQSSKRMPHKRVERCPEFSRKTSLTKCLNIHRCPYERPFMCMECGKSFKRNYNLTIHKRTHSRKLPFTCHQCGRKFTQTSNLNTHLMTHSKTQPYTCKFCGKRFSRKGNLQRHLRIHTNEKPYKCKDCDKRFSDPGNLNKHSKVHSNERPYLCHQCGKSFKRQNNLDVHLRIHSEEYLYSCKDCDKKFKQSSNLKQHQKTHASERPNKCRVCGKTITHSGNLRKHIRSHASKKLQSCFVRVKMLTEKSSLKRHQRANTCRRKLPADAAAAGTPTSRKATRDRISSSSQKKPNRRTRKVPINVKHRPK